MSEPSKKPKRPSPKIGPKSEIATCHSGAMMGATKAITWTSSPSSAVKTPHQIAMIN